jgi:hypothetical protein
VDGLVASPGGASGHWLRPRAAGDYAAAMGAPGLGISGERLGEWSGAGGGRADPSGVGDLGSLGTRGRPGVVFFSY